jgi:flagellar hook-length control protein FliK
LKDDSALTSTVQGQDPASSGPFANPSPLNDTSAVTDVQISGNAAKSEVHLAVQGDQLGSVELHAHVAGEQVGAAIVVEKREAHAALSLELPALREALSEKNFRVEHIWLTQSALESTAGDTGNAHGQQSRQRHWAQFGDAQEQQDFASSQTGVAETEGIFDERGRLSVLA